MKKWIKTLVFCLSLIFGLFLLENLSTKASADELTVTTAADLQSAVNTAGGDRTIILGAGFPADITATIVLNERPHVIVIDGQGLTLQPNGTGKILTLNSSAGTSTSSLTIKNLNFDGLGGNAQAISTSWGLRGTFILNNVRINDFHSSADGGAMNVMGNTTLQNCTFINNSCTGGGYSGGAVAGSFYGGHLIVKNCKFINNQNMYVGSGPSGGEGGALWFYNPSSAAVFDFTNNYFEGNKAAETINSGGKAKLADGGAVAFFNIVQGTNISFNGNTFYNNIAGDDGGAILIQTNDNITSGVLLQNNTFYQNRALGQDFSGNSGGAIQIYANGSPGQGRKAAIDYINNTFVENSAVYDGGAIGSSGYITNASAGRYANNLFAGNTSRTAGRNNIADATASSVAGSGNLETNIGYDNGTASTVTMADVFGVAPVSLVGNYNGITAGTTSDAVIIPTVPIAPEKLADDKVSNLRDVNADAREFPRTAAADIGAVEIDWVKYDSNGGEFDLGAALAQYDGTIYYEGQKTNSYYQVGYKELNQIIPDGANELGATRLNFQFAGWSTDKNASEPDMAYQPGKTITIPKGNQTLYAVWKMPAVVVTGSVISKYQDESGTRLAEDETLTGVFGAVYQTIQKTIEGYVLKEIQGNASGTYTAGSQTVIYIYKKLIITPGSGTVVIKYQDESGAALAADDKLSGTIGENYQTTQKTIGGYNFKEVKGNASGKYTANSQTVIYIYTKNIEEKPTPPPSSTPPTPSTSPAPSKPALPNSTPKVTLTVLPTNQTAKKSVLPGTGDEGHSTTAEACGLILLAAGLLSVIRQLKCKKQ
ncbi:MucBP domain-containing protein [Lactovum odontotermitis]